MARNVYLIRKSSLGELLQKSDKIILKRRAAAGKKLSDVFGAAKKHGLDRKATPDR